MGKYCEEKLIKNSLTYIIYKLRTNYDIIYYPTQYRFAYIYSTHADVGIIN